MDGWASWCFGESEAELWQAAGYDPGDAASWRDAGVDNPSEALGWQLVECDASAAGELRALGYDPTTVPAIEGLAVLLTAA